MERVEKTVFISYRRTNAPWALAIYQNLRSNGYDVFFDYTGIASGDFEQIIVENIRARAHFLVLLTPSAVERCGDPGDWLRREIEVALECHRNIVSIMLEGFDFSSSSISRHLTGKLEMLRRYNGIDVPVRYFEYAMRELQDRFLNVPLRAVLHPASPATEAASQTENELLRHLPLVVKDELNAQQWFEIGNNSTDLDEQIRSYGMAISLERNFANAFNNRGVAHFEKGDLESAIRDLNEALRLKLDFPEAFNNRGSVRSEKGDLSGAIKDFTLATTLRPGFAEAFYGRSVARFKMRDLNGAIQDCDEAIRLNPQYAEAFNNRGSARGDKGDVKGAISDYDRAIWLKPGLAGAYRNRGLAKEKLGDDEGARRDLEEAKRHGYRK